MFAALHTECVARGVCEANTSEQSIHNSYESCNLFIQSNIVDIDYSTVFCIRSTESVMQLILLNVETLPPPVDRNTIFHVWYIFRTQRVEYGRKVVLVVYWVCDR